MINLEVNIIGLENGEKITYRQLNEGTGLPTLLLIHGNMSSSIHFQTLMERLSSNYHLVALDLPGFGDSSYNREHSSLLEFAEDVLEFVDAMNLETFDVLGWSTGGGIALELAYLIPERVKKVYLLSSVGPKGYPMFKKDSQFQPILTERLTTKEEIAQDPVQVLPVLKLYEDNDTEAMRTIWNYSIYTQTQPEEDEYNQYLTEILKQRNLVDIDYSLVHFNITDESNGVAEGSGHVHGIKAEVFIIHGEKDLVVPVSEAELMKTVFGDQATLHVFEGAGHAIVQDDMDGLVKLLIDGGR